MKKVYVINALIFLLLGLFLMNYNSEKETKYFIENNVGQNYISVEFKNQEEEFYEMVGDLTDEHDSSYFYIVEDANFFLPNYKIETNQSKIIIGDKTVNLQDTCIQTFSLLDKNNCEIVPGIDIGKYNISSGSDDALGNGRYIFWGDDLTQFGKELNNIFQEETVEDLVSPALVVRITCVISIVFLIFLVLILLIMKLVKEEKLRNILILEGYTKKRIIGRMMLKFIQCNLLILLGISLAVRYVFNLHGEMLSIYILLSIIVFLVEVIIYCLVSWTKTDKSINIVLKSKAKSKGMTWFINAFKMLTVIIFTILLVNMIFMLNSSVYQYNQINKAMNIRNDYGKFMGSSVGNDTEEYFYSDEFREESAKASREILEREEYFLV